MKTFVFDIEGNGLGEIVIDRKGKLIPECDKVHLLVLRSYPDGKTSVYRNNEDEDTIAEGWSILKTADVVIGHNIIQYDLPVLKRLYGGSIKGRPFDTFTAACVLWSDVKNHPFGGNGVDDFAVKFGMTKVGKDITDWSTWTQDMEDRCVNDCVVQHKIFDFIKPKAKKFIIPIRLEHAVAEICADMQDNGVTIDIEGCENLIEHLEMQKVKYLDKLQEVFPPVIETMKTPSYYEDPFDNAIYAKKKDASAKIRKRLKPGPLKTKEHPFNPGSSMQVAARLKERHGWIAPTTELGNPTVNEDTLKGLPYEEAIYLVRANMAEKRLQHCTDWVRRARASRTPGRIHPQIKPCGCATSRASHQQPNQTACPKVLDPDLRGFEGRYGWEMRSLWGPREGWVQVGGDASGLELRELGSSLAIYDGGKYAREVVTGDIHTLNMKAGGLSTRDQSKTVIYAYLYGAGDAHIGEVITEHPSLTEAAIKVNKAECDAWVKKGKNRDREKWLRKIGRKFRDTFETKIPALAKLTAWCRQCASERGFVPLLDGRHAPVRAEYSALNTKLQGDGAITMKLAMVILTKKLIDKGYMWTRCAFMLWPHDEFQLESEPEIAEEVGGLIVESIVEAGVRLKLKCSLDGDYKVGKSWAECH